MESKYIDLTINRLTQAQYDELKNTNQVSEEELYIIIDHDDLFYYKTELYTKDEINSLLEEIRNSFATDENFTNLTNRVSTNETNISNLQTNLQSTNQSLSTLDTNFQNYQQTVSRNYIKTVDADEKYVQKGVIDGQLSDLDTRITNEVSDRTTAISTLRSEISVSNSDLASAIAAEETNRKTADTGLGNRITTIENLVQGITTPMDFKGVITTDPTTITSGYKNGNIVIYGSKEYVWSGNGFVELGDTIVDSSVQANTPLTGTEEPLESITIDDVTYSVGTSTTAVEANTPLEGTEPVLESLTINDNTYSVLGNTLSLSTERVADGYSLKSLTINGDSWNIPVSSGTGTGEDVDLSDYYTKSEVEGLISTEVTTLLNGAPEAYDTLKEISDYIESDLNNAAAMLASINNKADKTEVYTQSEANAKFATKESIPTIPDMTQYYTKTETEAVIDEKIGDISGLDDYYNKGEIDAKITTINSTKQDLLVSGTNIKTINGEDILGEGNITIVSGGGSDQVDMIFSDTAVDGATILHNIQIGEDNWSTGYAELLARIEALEARIAALEGGN